MGYGVPKAVQRISLRDFDGSDNWVDIKAGRSSATAARVQSAAMRLGGVDAIGRPQLSPTIDMAAMRRVLFAESIVAWSLKEEDNDAEPLPLTSETFDNRLDSAVAEWLDGQITTYYAQRQRSEAERGNLPAPSTAP